MSGLRKTLLLAGNTSGANSTTRLRPTTPWAGVAVEIKEDNDDAAAADDDEDEDEDEEEEEEEDDDDDDDDDDATQYSNCKFQDIWQSVCRWCTWWIKTIKTY